MKLGVKIFGIKDKDFLDVTTRECDFIEAMAILNNDYDFLRQYGKEIVLHAQHQEFKINPADSKLQKENIVSMNFALELADKLGARKIVTHPGVLANENCSEETSISFFKDFKEKRILIENLPPINSNKEIINALCSTPEQTANFLKKTNKDFCFDIPHSILSSVVSKEKDYKNFIDSYLALLPKHFHLSDIIPDKLMDHLNIGDGEIDIELCKSFIPESSQVTLETGINAQKVINDIKKMRR